jgi:hypothetical protein
LQILFLLPACPAKTGLFLLYRIPSDLSYEEKVKRTEQADSRQTDIPGQTDFL